MFRGITSNLIGDFCCLGCLNSLHTDNVFKRHERLCDKHDYCHVKMPTEDNKILKYNHGEKSLIVPFIIIFDLECWLKNEQFCQNNPEKSYTERKVKYKPSGWAMFTMCSLDKEKNRFDYYRGIDLLKRDVKN